MNISIFIHILILFLIGISLASAQECNINGICINSNLLDLTNATSGIKCLEDCKEFPGCQWYSFNQGLETTCELLDECNELSTEDCDHCESGQVDCDLIQDFSKLSFFLQILRLLKINFNIILAKLMITANWGLGTESTKSYIIDIIDGTTCDLFSNYPDDNNVHDPAWGLLKQMYPFVCDGNESEDINDCYIFQNGEWQTSVSLTEPSRWSGSTILNETTLWMAGNYEGYYMNLSLLVNPFEGTVQPGPELLYNVRTQCMVNIDDDSVMFIGGYDGIYDLDQTLTYSFAQDSWEMGPTLTTERIVPSCALLTLGGIKKVIFVVEDNISEYLELEGDNVWKEGT